MPHVAGGRESQYAGDRPIPAQGRCVLPAPHLQGRRAVRGGVRQVSGLHDGARPSAGIFHRGRPQPHRAPALAAHRHAVDDRARYLRDPKRPVVFMPVYFGYERIVEGRTYIGELSGQPKEKESVLGLIKSTAVGAAQQVRQGARQSGRAHRARRIAVAAQSRTGARTDIADAGVAAGMGRATPSAISPRASTSASTRPRR